MRTARRTKHLASIRDWERELANALSARLIAQHKAAEAAQRVTRAEMALAAARARLEN